MLKKLKEFFTSEDKSKDVAKKRLQLVLFKDRINLSRKDMNEMNKELAQVLKKYFKVEDQDLDIDFNEEEDCVALTANIPMDKI